MFFKVFQETTYCRRIQNLRNFLGSPFSYLMLQQFSLLWLSTLVWSQSKDEKYVNVRSRVNSPFKARSRARGILRTLIKHHGGLHIHLRKDKYEQGKYITDPTTAPNKIMVLSYWPWPRRFVIRGRDVTAGHTASYVGDYLNFVHILHFSQLGQI